MVAGLSLGSSVPMKRSTVGVASFFPTRHSLKLLALLFALCILIFRGSFLPFPPGLQSLLQALEMMARDGVEH